jgi:hypothetical protein
MQVIFDLAIFSVKTASFERHDHHDVKVVSEYSNIPMGGEARFSHTKRQVYDMRVLKYFNTRKNIRDSRQSKRSRRSNREC